jgi:hypothetical protein
VAVPLSTANHSVSMLWAAGKSASIGRSSYFPASPLRRRLRALGFAPGRSK